MASEMRNFLVKWCMSCWDSGKVLYRVFILAFAVFRSNCTEHCLYSEQSLLFVLNSSSSNKIKHFLATFFHLCQNGFPKGNMKLVICRRCILFCNSRFIWKSRFCFVVCQKPVMWKQPGKTEVVLFPTLYVFYWSTFWHSCRVPALEVYHNKCKSFHLLC